MSSSGKASGGAIADVPSYVTAAAAKHNFDPITSSYNFKANSLYWARRALDRVAAQVGCFNVGVIGDSLTIGYDGTTENRAKSWPDAMADQLAILGFPRAGDGVVPVVDAAPIASQCTFTSGAWNTATGKSYVIGPNGGVLTFQSIYAGTVVSVIYGNNSSVGGFSVAIDGGAGVPVVPAGGQSKGTYTVTGLANTTHRVVITCAANNQFIFSVRCDNLPGNAGVIVNTLSMGGSQVVPGNGNYSNNWNATDGVYYQLDQRLGELPTTQDMWLVCIGGTDMESHGSTAAQMAAGYQTLIGKLLAHSPNSNIVLVALISFADLQFTTWPGWLAALFQLADTNNLPILDWNDRLGGYANALAMGMLGADNLHFNFGTQAGFGRGVAQQLVFT